MVGVGRAATAFIVLARTLERLGLNRVKMAKND
jgi:hypothetical protein